MTIDMEKWRKLCRWPGKCTYSWHWL